MPELPEVEHARRLCESVAAGARILAVECEEGEIVLQGVTASVLREALCGRQIQSLGRRGKQLWWELDRRPWPLFHLGMSGAFMTPDAEALSLQSHGQQGPDTQWPPRFTRLLFRLDRGRELAFVSARRLSKVRLQEHPLQVSPLADLGPDALWELPEPELFQAALQRRKRSIKGLLLDQQFLAGIGNWIADEVLFQARLDPRRPAQTLRTAEAAALREAIAEVLHIACAADARKRLFPPDWLFHRRWGRVEGQLTPEGEAVEFMTVAGRTTAWVPARQR